MGQGLSSGWTVCQLSSRIRDHAGAGRRRRPAGVAPAKPSVTIRDVLRHTAGFAYGGGPKRGGKNLRRRRSARAGPRPRRNSAAASPARRFNRLRPRRRVAVQRSRCAGAAGRRLSGEVRELCRATSLIARLLRQAGWTQPAGAARALRRHLCARRRRAGPRRPDAVTRARNFPSPR